LKRQKEIGVSVEKGGCNKSPFFMFKAQDAILVHVLQFDDYWTFSGDVLSPVAKPLLMLIIAVSFSGSG
jgi:hypothetical protein